MFSVQKTCEKISQKIANELELEENKRAIIQYGLFAILQTSIAMILTIILGSIFNVLVPSLIIVFTALILRKYSGGAHAETPEACAAIGTIVSVGGAKMISWITWNEMTIIVLGIIFFALAFYLINRLAPVDSKAKPINGVKKKQLLKKKSIFVLCVYVLLSIISLQVYLKNGYNKWLLYIVCIDIGMIWQCFTLTDTGHWVVMKVGCLFNKLVK